MRHSVYIRLATLLVKAELKREEREWRNKLRRASVDIPWHNAHLLKDIGLDSDYRAVIGSDEPPAVTAERRLRHLRRVVRTRILT